MPPHRVVNGRRDSVASADGPDQGPIRTGVSFRAEPHFLGRPFRAAQGGVPPRAMRPSRRRKYHRGLPFQGEEARRRSMSFLHGYGRRRSDGALPLAG